jgi:hypothetical protein
VLLIVLWIAKPSHHRGDRSVFGEVGACVQEVGGGGCLFAVGALDGRVPRFDGLGEESFVVVPRVIMSGYQLNVS